MNELGYDISLEEVSNEARGDMSEDLILPRFWLIKGMWAAWEKHLTGFWPWESPLIMKRRS
jgi:hypothetical protein